MDDFDSNNQKQSRWGRPRWGGTRKGSGRPKGELALRTQLIAERVLADGLTPLEYMLTILRDPTIDYRRRDTMAIAAAPYVHPRLAATETRGTMQLSYEDKLAALEDDSDSESSGKDAIPH
jgi:hypothetical protein